MASLSDSDGSDDDFQLRERVFAKPETEKQELKSIEALEDILSGNPIVPKDTGQKRKKARKRQIPNKNEPKKPKLSKSEILRQERQEERRNDPEWIEKQARRTVNEELSLDVVDKITDLNDVGWFSMKKGRTIEYYPAIISRNKAEANILLQNSGKKHYKTINIQYIGVAWGSNLKHQEIASSKWIPYPKSSEEENEERLQKFLKTISKKDRCIKNNPLDLKIEEFAIRKMWGKVKVQMEQRQLEEEKGLTDALQSSGDCDPSGPSVHAETVTQESDNVQNNEEEDDGDIEESDEESLASPGGKQKKRTALRVDDEIEYYDVIGTFGNPSSLRKAKIVGMRPNHSYPLVLSSTIMLVRTHSVRRLPDGFWQPINNFVLLQGGVQSFTGSGSGFDNAKKQMKRVEDEIIRARDEFLENEYKKMKD